MLSKKFVFKFLALSVSFWQFCWAEELELTIEIDPAKRECFHQHIKQGSNFEFEYQVIDGGELDVNFMIQTPGGRILITDIRKTDASHRYEAQETGDYSFCLDNTFSRFSSKLVFFELLVDSDEEEGDDYADLPEEDTAALEIKVDELKSSLHRIKEHIDKGKQIQSVLRAIETRDRSQAEDNFERVNFWSGVQVFVMISVAITHVLMIRSLFEDKHKFGGRDMKMRT